MRLPLRTVLTCSVLLVKTLLNVSSAALAVLAGLAGMLFASWSTPDAAAEHHAVSIAILCAVVPFATVRFAADVLANAVDGVFICWALDLDSGANHCTKAVEAFGEPIGEASLPR